jgi:hypothetical protein
LPAKYCLHEIFATSIICADAFAVTKIANKSTNAKRKTFTKAFLQILPYPAISTYYLYWDKGQCRLRNSSIAMASESESRRSYPGLTFANLRARLAAEFDALA